MVIARQSTARTVMVGPVLDADGVAVTDGVVGDLKISKNGGAPAALNGSATLTHRHTGFYSLALTASDLDTVGQAEVVIDDTVNACPMKAITVIEEAVYDALFAASATGALPVSSGGIAAAAFAAGAIDAAAIANGAIDAATFAADVDAEILSYLVDDATRIDASALNTASGTTIPAILDDTDLIDDATSGLAKIATDVAAILVDTGTTLQGELDGIQADTEDIQTRLPAALVGGRIDATVDATGLEAGALALINAEVDTALTDIHLDHLLAATYDPASKPGAADALLNELVENDGGVARYTANALEQAPTGGSAPTAGEIADAVWEEALADHEGTVGSTAEALADAGGAGASAADIADAVWDELQSGHVGAGSFGEVATEIAAILVDTAEIGAAGAGLTNINLPNQTMDIVGNITGNLSGSVGSVTGNVGGNVTGSIGSLATQAKADVNAEADTALADVGVTTTITGRIDAAVSTRATPAQVATELGTYDAPTKAELDAGLAALNNLSAAQVLTQVNSALDTTLADSIPADGTRPTLRQAAYMIAQFLMERSVSGTTLTVRKADGSTALMTFTLSDATNPTSLTRAS